VETERKKPDSGGMETTASLLAAIQRGDAGAADRLYERYADRVLAIVRLRMGAELRGCLESGDLAQSALLASLQGIQGFEYRHEGAFLHWLAQVVENRIRNEVEHFHRQRRDRAREVPLEAAGTDVLAGRTAGPQTKASLREQMARLEAAMEQLPPHYREIILLRKYEGLSFKEIAKRLGQSEDACRMLLARALAALSKRFVPEL